MSSDETLPAGSKPPYVQAGMVIQHKEGGPFLVVDSISDFRDPKALCVPTRNSVLLRCAEIRVDYRLVENFTP